MHLRTGFFRLLRGWRAPARRSLHPSAAFELLFSMLLLLIVGGFSTYLVLAW